MLDYGFGVGLRKVSSYDLPFLFKWRNDERIRRWCRQPDELSYRAHEDWFEWQSTDKNTYMYTICNSSDSQISNPLGVCGLTSVDFINRRAEFSLYINPMEQRKGLGEKALLTLFKHGFYSLGLQRIWGECFEGNRAIRLFEKIGMGREGVRKDFYFKDGKFIDCILVSIERVCFDSKLRSIANPIKAA